MRGVRDQLSAYHDPEVRRTQGALLTPDFGTFRRQPASIPTYRAGQKSLESTGRVIHPRYWRDECDSLECRPAGWLTSGRQWLWLCGCWSCSTPTLPQRSASADASPCYGVGAVSDPERNSELVLDCNILLELREELAGDGDLDWSTHESIHFWDGVALGGSPLRVQGLRLADRGLTGKVPPELGNLTALRTLNLSHNDFEGGIPAELGDLPTCGICTCTTTS